MRIPNKDFTVITLAIGDTYGGEDVLLNMNIVVLIIVEMMVEVVVDKVMNEDEEVDMVADE